jgi:alpha-galactosidase
MRFITILLSLNLLFSYQSASGQFVKTEENKVTLDNGHVKRIIIFNERIYTERLFLNSSQNNYVGVDYTLSETSETGEKETTRNTGIQRPKSMEFRVIINDRTYTGERGWKVKEVRHVKDDHLGEGILLILESIEDEIKGVEIGITYMLYPGLPLIRKKISISNHSEKELKVEGLDIEHLNLPWWETHNVVLTDFGRQKRLGPYTGDWFDPVVAAHDVTGRRGIVIGNEAPGVMKRSTIMLNGMSLTAGLTHPGQTYPFRRWLSPSESWESPYVFIALYNHTDNPYEAINGPINDFVRRHMGTRLSEIKEKPVFVYNTWNPFMGNINDKMIREIARAAAECGVEEFIIDAGWYKNASGWEDPNDNWFNECGDWLIDEKKFPNGLKPVFDHIKSLGMKPGLWISLGNASLHSKVYKEHTEYWTIHPDGSNMFLHVANDEHNASACFSSEWPEYIKNIILDLVEEHGLSYAKLDLAVVTSPYHYDVLRSGCYATNHKHKDWEESLLMNFEELFKTFDEIHQEAPELFIDCTFETMGALQLIDYAVCQHAEGNWLSNFEEPSPTGSLRVRQMAWWRSPAIPASSLVIGNPRMDDPNPALFFKSLAGSLPIMLGDPRKLSKEERKTYKQLSDWLRQMQEKHNYVLFRQDLAGFGEPMEGAWDGFQRINNDTKSGGIIGVFRQGSHENRRKIRVTGLDENKTYFVAKCVSGKILSVMTGKELFESGFEVILDQKYDGELFEIGIR